MKTYPILLLAENKFPILPEGDLYKISENFEEVVFYELLNKNISLKFKLYQKVILDSIGYYPDISYIDKRSNTFIDIEIDEPYSRSGELTHYIESRKDSFRDKKFIQNGWNVLRFSENQVLDHPNECVNVVIFFIDQLKNNSPIDFSYRFNHLIQNGWTMAESQYFKERFIRDYYNHKVYDIQQNQIKVLATFPTRKSFIEAVITKFLHDFDSESEFVFIPFFISEHYLNLTDQTSLVFSNCSPSYGGKKINGTTIRTCHFSHPPKITIKKSNIADDFEKILQIKTKNERFQIQDDFEYARLSYNCVFRGTMDEYRNNKLKLIENLSL